MNISPVILTSHILILWFLRILSDNLAENKANAKHQIVPVAINVNPRIMNGNALVV